MMNGKISRNISICLMTQTNRKLIGSNKADPVHNFHNIMCGVSHYGRTVQ